MSLTRINQTVCLLAAAVYLIMAFAGADGALESANTFLVGSFVLGALEDG